MSVVINGTNTPTAGGVTYGNGTEYATTSAGTTGQALLSAGSSAPTWGTLAAAAGGTGLTSPGTSGNVLTSNGSAWTSATPAAAGSWIYLSTVTASASATVSIETTFDSTYDVYALVWSDVRNSASTGITVTLKVAGAYLTGSTDYTYKLAYPGNQNTTWTVGSDSGVGAVNIPLTSVAVGNNAADSFGGTMYIYKPSSATTLKFITWDAYCTSGGAAGVATFLSGMGGSRSTTGALTGVRFTPNSGNIAAGSFRLYGIKNS